MKIERISTSHMRNDAHFQFHTEFRDLVVRHNSNVLKVKPQFDVYLSMYSREDDALKRINKSALTQKIYDADKARADTFIGMAEINKGMCRHFNSHVRDAALRLRVVFQTYGAIQKKPLNEQTSAYYNLLQDLKSDRYVDDAEKSGILNWADELSARNVAFDKLVKERFDESASKCKIIMRKARRDTDLEFNKIREIINVYVILDGAANYDAFIRTLNVVIAKYGGRSSRHSQSDAQTSSEEQDIEEEYDYDAVGGGSHGGGAIPLYDPDKHYSEYRIGDKVRMPNGDIYRVKDLGQVHYAPDSANGHLGWEKI